MPIVKPIPGLRNRPDVIGNVEEVSPAHLPKNGVEPERLHCSPQVQQDLDEHRFVQVGGCAIFFRVRGEGVFADRIRDDRRDFASLLGL